jgi:hypothetical protein
VQEFMFTTLDDIPNKKSFERGLASPLTLRTFRAECGTHNPVQAPEQYIVWVTDSQLTDIHGGHQAWHTWRHTKSARHP